LKAIQGLDVCHILTEKYFGRYNGKKLNELSSVFQFFTIGLDDLLDKWISAHHWISQEQCECLVQIMTYYYSDDAIFPVSVY
jgi:hypothetical protein